MREPMTPVALADIKAARARLGGIAVRTPLVRLGVPDAGPRTLLKLENLQPIGSFKLRGAVNAMTDAGEAAVAKGVYTASAGNMAQGLAGGHGRWACGVRSSCRKRRRRPRSRRSSDWAAR
jgi:threonine dehydratase